MDSGINAISVVTALTGATAFDVHFAVLTVPAHLSVETRAVASFAFGNRGRGRLDLDWRSADVESRRVALTTLSGKQLQDRSEVDQEEEYAGVYARFATAVRQGDCDPGAIELAFVQAVYAAAGDARS